MKKKSQYPGGLICIILIFTVNIAVYAQQGAAINTSGAAADPSAMLDLSSNNSGFLIPRMTTAERNAIFNPAEGLQIINTTTKCIEVYFSPIWQTVFCGCKPPSAPAAGTHSPTDISIEWNWNSVSGATGYKYNTVNNYASATDNGTNTSFSQISLTCATSYTLYVWAYSTCGNSAETILTETTSACFNCGTSTVNFIYNSFSVTYGTVAGNYDGGQYCWLDRNLGATAVATAVAHSAGYGDLFQWGRLDDGHQVRTSMAVTTQSSSSTPGHSNFIKGYQIWYSGSNPDNLWQGVSGTNNPCPAGWRLPTETELNNERSTWASIPGGGNNYNGAILSALKLPAAGFRNYSDGLPSSEGSASYYWSSTFVSGGINARRLGFTSSNAFINDHYRAYGCSVRCIKD